MTQYVSPFEILFRYPTEVVVTSAERDLFDITLKNIDGVESTPDFVHFKAASTVVASFKQTQIRGWFQSEHRSRA